MLRCSFCERTEDQVERIIYGASGCICNDCKNTDNFPEFLIFQYIFHHAVIITQDFPHSNDKKHT